MYNKLSNAIKAANYSFALRKTAAVAGSAAALALMGMTAHVYADDAAVEEITVTGIRASLQHSLDIKRNSDAIVDAVTAEDVGKFPDKNVAESLQRIPGVTIQRGFGEGAAVSIRGTGQDLTLTTLNGQNVASTGWFVLEPARRSFNYELLPSELVGGLEVYKSTQANLAEGGVGGTVVVHTRKPLDMKSLSLYGSVEAQSQSDSGSVDPKVSAMGSWKNDENTFGALASVVYQKRQLQRQGNEAFWEWGAGPVAFEQDRQREAETLTLQFKPSDNLDVVFNAINMEMKANNTNYALWLTQGNTSWGVPVTPGQQQNGAVVKGPLNVAFYQERPREATMKSKVFDVAATYTGDGYEAKVQVGKTNSSGGTDFEMVVNDGTGGTPIVGGTFDFSKGKQTWSTGNLNLSTYNPGTLEMGTGSSFNRTPKKDGEDYLQGDIKFDVDLGAIKTISTGAKYSSHNTQSTQWFFDQKAGFNAVIPTSQVSGGTIDVGAGDYVIQKFDADKLKAWAKASIIGQHEDLGSHSEIDEKNKAAYVMATFEQDALKGNLGIRYITTDATSTYYLGGKKGHTDGSYSEFLPSINTSYKLTDDVTLRVSAGRAAARPQYNFMYANPTPNGTNDGVPNNQFWISGNPALKPYISDQFDFGAEWYFAEKSMLSAAFFTKDVMNFISNSTKTNVPASQVPFTLVDPAEAAKGWTVQSFTNGKQAKVSGIELQYQQDFGNGFGTLVNYTYTDTNTDADAFKDGNGVLTDSSRNSYNITGYFENETFNVRLAYNFRSAYMLREIGAYGNRLHDDFGSLDFSSSWNVTDNVSVKLDANNLLTTRDKQFGNNAMPDSNDGHASGFTKQFPVYEYETSRNVSLGVNFKF
jgi:iron complex outermembrane receptor protein